MLNLKCREMKMCFDKQTVKTCGTVIFENDNNLTTTILNKEQKRSSDKKNPLAALNTALNPLNSRIFFIITRPNKKKDFKREYLLFTNYNC